MSTIKCLLLTGPEDKEYFPYLKGAFNGLDTFVSTRNIETLAELEIYCEQRGISRVATNQVGVLSKLLEKIGNIKTNPSLNDYAGSLFTYKSLAIVCIPPLSSLFTVSYGKFLCERYISKIAAPDTWAESTKFKFHIPKLSELQGWYEKFSCAYAIAIDIETFKHNLAIRCVGYTGVFIDSLAGSISTITIVFPLDSEFALHWVRKFNELPAQKIFQNGKYDNSYFLRYGSPVRNWLWDTQYFFHSWYSELPKDLAFLNAFFLREVVYWKDLAETSDLYEYYRYCGLDTWATANVWIQQLRTAPDWAKHNYTLEFPLNFPCLLAEMTGIERDMDRLIEQRGKIETKISKTLNSLRTCLSTPAFNPGSPKQVTTLLKILGFKDATSSGEKELEKASFMHPLVSRILDYVLEYRGLKKLATTYLRTDDDAKQSGIYAGEGGAKEFNGTILFALNPHGTDSGRLASREHHFWCGLQIQNIPRGNEVKCTLRAADGFVFGECDLEQAESRDTAYIAGDNRLIEAVSGTKDFHSANASAFFGKSYDSIYDDRTKKTLDKPLRDLSKRTNHGATYNMRSFMLVSTMGLKRIFEARRLLGLSFSDPIKIGDYLLNQFHTTYPSLKGPDNPYSPGTYYAWVAREISIHKMLRSSAFHHTEYNIATYTLGIGNKKYPGDWTRYCFGKPDKNKLDLNSYVSHPPQSLNARTLNEAWMKVFYESALPNPQCFRLHAQIHDSILFSIRIGRVDLAAKVKSCMEIPVTISDIHGVNRTFTVPAALKLGSDGTGAKYWSDIE